MKTSTFITLSWLLFATAGLQAQDLTPFKDANGRFGYRDGSGKMAIRPIYNDARAFFEGLAAARIEKDGMSRWGFIDGNGKVAIPFKYADAGDFSEGLAVVIERFYFDKPNQWGAIDRTGRLVVPLKYNNLSDFKDGKARAELDDRTFYIDKTGAEVAANAPVNPNPATAASDAANHPGQGQLVGVWNVTIKDQKFGLPDSFKIEIKKITNGKAEVWMLDKGKPYKQYNNFEITRKDNGILGFAFQFSHDGKTMQRGAGTVSGNFDRMEGTQLTPLSSTSTRVEDWTAQKETGGKGGATQPEAAKPPAVLGGALAPFEDASGKFGYKNAVGKIIIPAKYDNATGFHGGIANVNIGATYDKEAFAEMGIKQRVGGKWGMVNAAGNIVIPIQYVMLGTFSEGLVEFNMDGDFSIASEDAGGIYYSGQGGKWGFLDGGGKVVIQPQFSLGASFKDGLALVNKGGSYAGALAGNAGGLWGFINKAGREVIPIKYEEAGLFKDGRAKVRLNGRTFYINKAGAETDASPAAKSAPKAFKGDNGKWGLKDGTGTVIMPPRYDAISGFSQGMAAVMARTGNIPRFGYIDSAGTLVIPATYSYAGKFQEGLAAVVSAGKYGFVDTTGKMVIPAMYAFPTYGFTKGLAAVTLEGKTGFIDKDNRTVIPFKYDKVISISDKDGMALVKTGAKYSFIDLMARRILSGEYDQAYLFSEDMAAVNNGGVRDETTGKVTGGKWGFIDRTGKLVIRLQYDEVSAFAEGLVSAKLGDRVGFIDKTGRSVIPFIYDQLSYFKYGRALMNKNGKYLHIDKDGREARAIKKVTFGNAEYIGEVAENGSTPHGKGKMTWADGATYEGDWVNEKHHGHGKLTTADGKVYEGNFVNGKFTGAAKAPTPAADPGKGAIYEQLAGQWEISTKDQASGRAGKAAMEIRVAGGALEVWRVVKGKADIKYTSFTVFSSRDKWTFTFELNVPPSLKVEGVGSVSGDFATMTGQQILSGFGPQAVADWSAKKVAPGNANGPVTPVGKVRAFKDDKGKMGLRDSNATVILAPKYDWINDFSEGLARVVVHTGESVDVSHYGYIDATGREVIPVIYSHAGAFQDGLAYVAVDRKVGFIDKTGKMVIAPMYELPGRDFREGLAAARLNGKTGFIDKNNTTVLPFIYGSAQSFKDGMALVTIDGKYGFIDKTGRQVIPTEYDEAYEFFEGLAAVKKGAVKNAKTGRMEGGRWGFVDKSGKVVVPLQYDQVLPFSEGLARVSKDGKAGFIDTAGNLVIPMIYETSLTGFQYGTAKATLNGRRFFIDKTGKEARPSKKVTFADGIYIGEVADANSIIPDGKGTMTWDDGATYEGGWANGKTNGYGTLTQADGKIYTGKYRDGRFVGATKAPAAAVTAVDLTPFQDAGGKWGYKNAKGDILVAAKYALAQPFSEGLAAIAAGNGINVKFGYIDGSGTEVIAPVFSRAGSFSEGMAPVNFGGLDDKKWGFIDRDGDVAIQGAYVSANAFSEGLASVDAGDAGTPRFGFIDTTGKTVIQPQYQSSGKGFSNGIVKVNADGKDFYINKTGGQASDDEVKRATASETPAPKPAAPASKAVETTTLPAPSGNIWRYETGGNWGLKNSKGQTLTDRAYFSIGDFSEGMAVVQIRTNNNGANKSTYGYINETGYEVIPVQYEAAYDFHEGLAKVGQKGKYGFIDQSGIMVIPFMYEFSPDAFSEGLAAVGLNGKTGFIDNSNRTVLPFEYDSLYEGSSFKDGVALVAAGGKYKFIDRTGRQAIPGEYDYAEAFSEGLALVNKGGVRTWRVEGGKWGFIDKTGAVVIPLQYDAALSFREGLAGIMQGGKAGFIDKAGTLVIPLMYDEPARFIDGTAYVKLNGKTSIIDKTGNKANPSKKLYFNGEKEYIGEATGYPGTPDGQGRMAWANGDVYEGGWKNGQMHGKGKWTNAAGKVIAGDFTNGKFPDVAAPVTVAPAAIATGVNSIEGSFCNAFNSALTAGERGKALSAFFGAVYKDPSLTAAQKKDMMSRKLKDVCALGAESVFQAVIKTSSADLPDALKTLTPEQQAFMRRRAQETANKILTKYNKPGYDLSAKPATPVPTAKPPPVSGPPRLLKGMTMMKVGSKQGEICIISGTTASGYAVWRSGAAASENREGQMAHAELHDKSRWLPSRDWIQPCGHCEGAGSRVKGSEHWSPMGSNVVITYSNQTCDTCKGTGYLVRQRNYFDIRPWQ